MLFLNLSMYGTYPSFSQPRHLKLPLTPMSGPGAHKIIIGDLQRSHRESSLYEATLWSFKLANHLCIASFSIRRKSTADPPFCLLKDLAVLGDGGELFHHLGLAQLREHLHNKGKQRFPTSNKGAVNKGTFTTKVPTKAFAWWANSTLC